MVTCRWAGILVTVFVIGVQAESALACPWCWRWHSRVAPAPLPPPASRPPAEDPGDGGLDGGLDEDLGAALPGEQARFLHRLSPVARRLLPVLVTLLQEQLKTDDAKLVLELIRILIDLEAPAGGGVQAAGADPHDDFERRAEAVETSIREARERLGLPAR